MPRSLAHLDRAELDRQLSPSRSAKDPWGVLRRHEMVTAALQSTPDLHLVRDVPTGPRPRARLDLATPAAAGPWPCVAWVHGGFWQEGSKAGSGFAAPALVAAKRALAAVGYSLAPEVRVRDIVDEIAAAVRTMVEHGPALRLDPSRIVLAGHSAGAHLAAAVLAGMGGAAAANGIAGVVLVSGVYDLAPVAASYVNDLARIEEAEIGPLSPLFSRPAHDVPVHILIGADEPDAFQQQSDALQAAWRPYVTRLTFHRAPARDHFDVLDELADPASPTFAAMIGMTA
jgi:arylformamidase